jgi:hypothetical protein
MRFEEISDEELYNLYTSPYIIRNEDKEEEMAGHVAHIRKGGMHTVSSWEIQEKIAL